MTKKFQKRDLLNLKKGGAPIMKISNRWIEKVWWLINSFLMTVLYSCVFESSVVISILVFCFTYLGMMSLAGSVIMNITESQIPNCSRYDIYDPRTKSYLMSRPEKVAQQNILNSSLVSIEIAVLLANQIFYTMLCPLKPIGFAVPVFFCGILLLIRYLK